MDVRACFLANTIFMKVHQTLEQAWPYLELKKSVCPCGCSCGTISLLATQTKVLQRQKQIYTDSLKRWIDIR